MHLAPFSVFQRDIAVLRQFPDGRVDGLLAGGGQAAYIPLEAAVAKLADGVQDIKGAVGQPEAQCDVMVDAVCFFVDAVVFF